MRVNRLTDTTVLCKTCHTEKSIDEFYPRLSNTIQQPCKDCSNSRRRGKYLMYGKASSNPEHSKMLRDRPPKLDGEVWCSICKQYKLRSSFYGKATTSVCKTCQTDIESKRSMNLKKATIEFLGGECQKCHYKWHYASYDLHHPNPDKKEATWSILRKRSIAFILEFLQKENIILLYKNCHAEIHCSLTNNGTTNLFYVPKRHHYDEDDYNPRWD